MQFTAAGTLKKCNAIKTR